jgi:hypothetical protein
MPSYTQRCFIYLLIVGPDTHVNLTKTSATDPPGDSVFVIDEA